MKADKLRRYYKNVSSGYKDWKQKAHAEEYLIFPQNMGSSLSIDEVSLSQGELYTFINNKSGKGKKGSIVACVKGTLSKEITEVLEKISIEKRMAVKEVSLDMAKNMESAVKTAFPSARLVTDRFHVVKLATEAIQHMRVDKRWEALEKENKDIEASRAKGMKYEPTVLSNGDTPKQLLARCRYVLAKKQNDWTESQKQRAQLLFGLYPCLKQAYEHTLEFRSIYECTTAQYARERFTAWIEKTYAKEMKAFYTVANTVRNHMENILNFFTNRTTNASAESFNAKIKLFRANQRGVADTPFFLFRLTQLFA